MDKKIEKFIEEFIPQNISKEKKEELKTELICHIYDRIDYYKELGYTEEESFDRTLKDFGDEKDVKEKIKKDLGEIHIPWSLADFFSISIPITVGLIFVIFVLSPPLLKFNELKNLIVIPMVIWVVVLELKRTKKLHHLVKSIIAFLIVVPYFHIMFWAHFMFTTNLYTTLNKDEAISSYYSFMIDEENPEELSCILPHPKDIGQPIDANAFDVIEDSPLSNPSYYTWIFQYSRTEYKKIKEQLNSEIKYRDSYSEEDGRWINDEYQPNYIKYNCSFSSSGFDFKTIFTPEEADIYEMDEDYEWGFDYWAFIGTNDETNEIAFIYLTPHHFTPSFDEHFIKEDCGWRYFYYLTKF